MPEGREGEEAEIRFQEISRVAGEGFRAGEAPAEGEEWGHAEEGEGVVGDRAEVMGVEEARAVDRVVEVVAGVVAGDKK